MITQEEYDKLVELTKITNKISGKCEDHVQKCLEAICEVYNAELSWWVFPAGEINGETYGGDMDLGGDYISIYYEADGGKREPIYEGMYLNSYFPTEFLFKPVEKVRELVRKDLAKQIKEEEKKKARKKAQREARKAKKAALQQSAKTKLTLEEAEALGIK